LYYGGNAYENHGGLGQQWNTDGSGVDEPFGIPEYPVENQHEGLQVIRIAALYTPGTLNSHSEIIASRLAQPELFVNGADARRLAFFDGDRVSVQMNGRILEATVNVSSRTVEGLALLRGVPFIPGTVDVQIDKIEEREKDIVA